MEVSFDTFSEIRFHLLATIISFLPLKEAVKTSVLSKKWLNIYKSTTNIEFSEVFFVKHDQPDETREAQRRAFLDFIKFWIENRQGTVVDKFSLRLSNPRNVDEIIDGCVAFATERGVKELELDFVADENRNKDMFYFDCHEGLVYFDCYEALLELPAQVYQHRSLESLKLYSCSFVDAEMFNFHALKELSLGWMEVKLTDIKAVLSHCQMLESLSFKKCWNSDTIGIAEQQSMGLRKLVLDKCAFNFKYFVINAPNLQIFKYCGLLSFFTIQFLSPAIEEVVLDFSPDYGRRSDIVRYRICKLVASLYDVRVLTVCSLVLQVIGSERQRIRDLHVRHLIMKTVFYESKFMGITFFLNNCPMLECLTIEICSSAINYVHYSPPYYFNRNIRDDIMVDLYGCLSSRLKVVEINGFRGDVNEHLLITYLMHRGLVLKKISINMFKDASGNVEPHCRERAEILLTSPRASGNLEISIS